MAVRKKFNPRTPIGVARLELKKAQLNVESDPSKFHKTALTSAQKNLLKLQNKSKGRVAK